MVVSAAAGSAVGAAAGASGVGASAGASVGASAGASAGAAGVAGLAGFALPMQGMGQTSGVASALQPPPSRQQSMVHQTEGT